MSSHDENEAAGQPAARRPRRRRRRLPHPDPAPPPGGIDRQARARERRDALRAQRAGRVPESIDFPESLPVNQHREEIADLLRRHPVVIVAGATGSGKTTQLPKIALQLGRGRDGQIGITQPRRLAATSVAARVAQELGSSIGEAVGYQIRFEGRGDPATPIKFMTDGILLAEIRRDPDLAAYDTLILDEVHERGLNTDFLLGYVRRLLPRRPELRVAVSSATLAVERFSEFFGGAPVVEVEGRVHHIETRYRPPGHYLGPDPDGNDPDDPDLPALVRAALDELAAERPGDGGDGDVLVFLAGEADIRAVADALERDNPRGDLILPLYARLPGDQQRRVFFPANRRKVVLSTNVAETSLTIPGIRAVVDTGLARVRRAAERTGVERLRIEAVSRASADQRRGRCGRTGPGVCVRLYGADDYEARAAFTDPEIRRAGLAGVILQMKSLELGEIESFPFLDPPKPAAVAEGYRTLLEIGALDDARRLTPVGRRLARLPLEPRLARMLDAAGEAGVADEMLVIVGFLSIQDPRERPHDKRGEADALHRRFAHARSDFVGLLALWDFHQDALAEAPSKSALRRFCRKNFLNHLRMEEWRDIHRQLAGQLRHSPRTRGLAAADWSGLRPRAGDPLPDRYAALHRALLTGLLGRVGKRGEGGEYTGARGVGFRLWPGGGVAQLARLARASQPFGRQKKAALPEVDAKGAPLDATAATATPGATAADSPDAVKGAWPDWVVAAELVETSRTYARLAAAVEPGWIEKAAGERAKRSYSDPYYDENSGFVRAYERVRVLGLTVAERRPIHYGPIFPAESRRIFIREALVEGKLKTRPPFFTANRAFVEDRETLAHKARLAGGVDPERVFDFYDARLPADVNHDRALRQWLVQDPERDRHLRLSPEDIENADVRGLAPDQFPAALDFEGRRYPLSYRFAPGADDDGVTLTLPAADLGALPAGRLDWLVPGRLGEKIAALLRGLPKSRRREFMPLARTALEALPLLGDARRPAGSFHAALARALGRVGGRPVPESEIAAAEAVLPPHLRMNLRVIDADGAVIAEGRDLEALRAQRSRDADDMFAGLVKNRYEKSGLTAWDFGDWPPSIALPGALAFPALVDEGRSAALRLCRTEAEAVELSRAGLMRLHALALAGPLAKTRAALPLSATTRMLAAADGYPENALRDDLLAGALAAALVDNQPPPRTREAFHARIEEKRPEMTRLAHEAARAVDAAWRASETLFAKLEAPPSPAQGEAYDDIRQHVRYLLSRRSVVDATPTQLLGLPRYLAALEKRRERLGWDLAKDRARRAEIGIWDARWREALAKRLADGGGSWRSLAALRDYRWLVEDYRAELFAPSPTPGRNRPTPRRLAEAWTNCGDTMANR